MALLRDAIEQHRSGSVFLLSEVKPQSPRDGDLLDGRNPCELAQTMEDAGVDAISVVTESDHFGGSYDLLAAINNTVDVPVLAKDFFRTRGEIDTAVANGADAVLLISSDLDVARLDDLHRYCCDVGVDALIETHTDTQVKTANRLGAPLVGINNRDIQELELDDGGVERTERLAPLVRDDTVVVSESSLRNAEEVRRASDAGADAVLVGTAILTAPDPVSKIESLRPCG